VKCFNLELWSLVCRAALVVGEHQPALSVFYDSCLESLANVVIDVFNDLSFECVLMQVGRYDWVEEKRCMCRIAIRLLTLL
jgi:hypothetical protein